jgi:hypothetical protein
MHVDELLQLGPISSWDPIVAAVERDIFVFKDNAMTGGIRVRRPVWEALRKDVGIPLDEIFVEFCEIFVSPSRI